MLMMRSSFSFMTIPGRSAQSSGLNAIVAACRPGRQMTEVIGYVWGILDPNGALAQTGATQRITIVGWLPAFQVSAGGVSEEGKSPPEVAGPEALIAKLTRFAVPAMAAQLLAQLVVKAR